MPGMARVNQPLSPLLAAVAAAALLAITLSESAPVAGAGVVAPDAREELVGQRFMVAMQRHAAVARAPRPHPSRRGRRRHPLRRQHHGPGPAADADGDAPERRAGRRTAAAPDLDRSGGRERAAPAVGRPGCERLRARRDELGEHQAGGAARRPRAAGGGVNVDLAPVADVPGAGSFMAADDRTFGASGAVVGRAATAFARGLADAQGCVSCEALPGDRQGDEQHRLVRSSRSARVARALERDLAPFRAAIAAGAPIVMISNASYPALDSKPAPWSPRIQSLLRSELGFKGVTITDALDGAAATRGRTVQSVAVLSAQAGIDILLLTGSEASSAAAYERLVTAASSGTRPAGCTASQLRPGSRAQAAPTAEWATASRPRYAQITSSGG